MNSGVAKPAKRPLRVAFCWTQVSGYMASCWRALAAQPGIDLWVGLFVAIGFAALVLCPIFLNEGFPAVWFVNPGFSFYHQITDEAQYADFDGMVRVAKLAESVVRAVGNLDHRPFVDFARHDPTAQCRQ